MSRWLAQFDRLPVNIVSEILTHVYGTSYPNYPDGVHNALSVSRDWRSIAPSTHSLWDTIDLRDFSLARATELGLSHEHLCRNWEKYFARSGVGPNITLSLGSDYCMVFAWALQTIKSIAPRCRKVTFEVVGDGGELWDFVRDASQLQVLEILTPEDGGTTPLSYSIVLNRLKELSLAGYHEIHAPQSPIPRDTLTCPQLEQLFLNDCIFSSAFWSAFSTQMGDSVRDVSLNAIRWLDYQEDESFDANYPYSRLELSNDRVADANEKDIISGCEHLSWLSLTLPECTLPPISQTLASLTELRLRFLPELSTLVEAEIHDWQKVFMHLPILEHLYLGTTSFHNYNYDQVSGKHAINPLLTSLILPSNPPLLSALRKLTYDVELKCDWSLLLAFSKSRSHIS